MTHVRQFISGGGTTRKNKTKKEASLKWTLQREKRREREKRSKGNARCRGHLTETIIKVMVQR